MRLGRWRTPYDPSRLPTFQALFARLREMSPPVRADRSSEAPSFHNVAFFDAYFSNYIKGTDFPVDQAIEIVFEGAIQRTGRQTLMMSWELTGS
jgi:hypothetical protein